MKKKEQKKEDFVRRTYKFRAYPTQDQIDCIKRTQAVMLDIYNDVRDQNREVLEKYFKEKQDGVDKPSCKFMSFFDLVNYINSVPEYRAIPVKCREYVAKIFSVCIVKYRKKQIRFPKNIEEFRTLGYLTLTDSCVNSQWFEGDSNRNLPFKRGEAYIRLPALRREMGNVAYLSHRRIDGQITMGGITQDENDWWYVFLVVKRDRGVHKSNKPKKSILLNSSDFTFQNDRLFNRKLNNGKEQLAILNTLEPKSESFNRQRRRNAEAWRKMSAYRNNVLHESSREMVRRYGKIKLKMEKFKIEKKESLSDKEDNLKYLSAGPTLIRNYLSYKTDEMGTKFEVKELGDGKTKKGKVVK